MFYNLRTSTRVRPGTFGQLRLFSPIEIRTCSIDAGCVIFFVGLCLNGSPKYIKR